MRKIKRAKYNEENRLMLDGKGKGKRHEKHK